MKKLFVVLIVFGAIGAWAWWIWHANAVQTAPNSAAGTIEADEVHVGSRHGGRVTNIFAVEGDLLTNGQLLVELEATELQAQRVTAAATLADLEAGARKEEIAAARADLEAISVDLDLARLEEKRALELFAQKTISDSERDQAVARTR